MEKFNWKIYACEFLGTAALLFLGLTGIYLTTIINFPLLIPYLVIGIFFGLGIILVTYSFLGTMSGAHINPAVTLAFWMCGHMKALDALLYMVMQFMGAVAGTLLAFLIFNWQDAAVTMTVPNVDFPTWLIVFLELVTTSILIIIIFSVMNSEKHGKFTGLVAGAYIMLVIACFASISGASLNPARSFGPAFLLMNFKDLWIYFIGPFHGTLLVILLLKMDILKIPRCSKLCYKTDGECLFTCDCEHKVVVQG